MGNIPEYKTLETLKIYGRDKELKVITSAFNHICNGEKEVIFICGPSGIGKTSLGNEVNKIIVEKKGRFARGKYEQSRTNVPHSGFLQAFSGLLNHILSEPQETIDDWKEEILNALGTNGRIITDIFPVLNLIIGEQPAVTSLDAEEERNRFNLVLEKFISALATTEHPLVLFLDDLHWADSASLDLLTKLSVDQKFRNLLILAAFRNDIQGLSLFYHIKDTILDVCIQSKELPLDVLDPEGINAVISDFLKCDISYAYSFSKVIHKKTNGNPLFVVQFIQQLYDQKLLVFDDDSKHWDWDLPGVSNMPVSGNVIDLIVSKLSHLNDAQREILKICSCIENNINFEMLVKVTQKSEEEIIKFLDYAISQGFMSRDQGHYVFKHDRIKEAVYAMISNEERLNWHYKIGNVALEGGSEEDVKNKIFWIANHLNASIPLMKNQDEKDNLAKLNLYAAQKSKSSAAYASSMEYLKNAVELCGPDYWQREYDLAFALFSMITEVAYLINDFDLTEKFSKVVIQNVRSEHEKIKIYAIKMRMFMGQDKKEEAVYTALDILKKLDVSFPEFPNNFDVLIYLIKMKLAMGFRKPEDLMSLPKMTDKRVLAAVSIIEAFTPIAYWARTEMIPLLIFWNICSTIKYGHSKSTPYNLCALGIVLCSLGDYKSGCRYAEIGLRFLDRLDLKDQTARVQFLYYTWIHHWKGDINIIPDALHDLYHLAMELGDFEFASHDLMVQLLLHLNVKWPLETTLKLGLKNIEIVQGLKQESQLNVLKMEVQLTKNMMSEEGDPTILSGDMYDCNTMLPIHEKAQDQFALNQVYIYQQILNYYFEKYDESFEKSKLARTYFVSAPKATTSYVNWCFYDALTHFAYFHSATGKRKRECLRQIKKQYKRFSIWAKEVPGNFETFYWLLKSEKARLEKKNNLASKLYEETVVKAKKDQIMYVEALAYERVSQLYHSMGREDLTQSKLKQARDCYSRWGAKAKVRHMERKYPFLLDK